MSQTSEFDLDTFKRHSPLYTPEQRKRRDNSGWTTVQGILAPIQFIVFLISLFLVFRTLFTGAGYEVATISIILKTLILYVIMVTGAIWEKVVFGKYLFVEAFFWEDVFSMLVLFLHTFYLLALFATDWNSTTLLLVALAAYATYVINAAQFLLKLRKARLDVSANSEADFHQHEYYPQPRAMTVSRRMGT